MFVAIRSVAVIIVVVYSNNNDGVDDEGANVNNVGGGCNNIDGIGYASCLWQFIILAKYGGTSEDDSTRGDGTTSVDKCQRQWRLY